MNKRANISMISIILVVAVLLLSPVMSVNTQASLKDYPTVILSHYNIQLAIGDEFYLVALTSTGKKPTFKSSDSKVASVNTYGRITAKKAGVCRITASIKNAEASCKVKVEKTQVILEPTTLTMENGKSVKLKLWSSTNHNIKWKSSKSSVAAVSEEGVVTSKKPGTCQITATVDGSVATCNLTVKSPTVKLNKTKVTLYRKGTVQLSAQVSSGREVVWKTNKKSVATVDRNTGMVTAIKHGEAIISASVDGVTKQCTVVVKQPTIKLSKTEVQLKKGNSCTIKATVSSGNPVEWSSSNNEVVTVNSHGILVAKGKGKAYVYAREDGVKARCVVKVTE